MGRLRREALKTMDQIQDVAENADDKLDDAGELIAVLKEAAIEAKWLAMAVTRLTEAIEKNGIKIQKPTIAGIEIPASVNVKPGGD